MVLDIFDVENLVCHMLGVNYDDVVVGTLFYEKYEVELEYFIDILTDLVKFTPIWKSPLTGELYQGFVDLKEGVVLIKTLYKDE